MTKKKMTKAELKKKPVDVDKWRAAGIKAAVTLLTRSGYRVAKTKAPTPKKEPKKAPARANGLNALGKPYSASFDPNYRMKHKPSYAHLYKSTGRGGVITAISPERWTEMCANAKAHWDFSRKHGTPLPYHTDSPVPVTP